MNTAGARYLGIVLAMMVAGLSRPDEAAASSKGRIGEKIQDVTLTDMEGQRVNLLKHHEGQILVIAYTGVASKYSIAPESEIPAYLSADRSNHCAGNRG